MNSSKTVKRAIALGIMLGLGIQNTIFARNLFGSKNDVPKVGLVKRGLGLVTGAAKGVSRFAWNTSPITKLITTAALLSGGAVWWFGGKEKASDNKKESEQEETAKKKETQGFISSLINNGWITSWFRSDSKEQKEETPKVIKDTSETNFDSNTNNQNFFPEQLEQEEQLEEEKQKEPKEQVLKKKKQVPQQKKQKDLKKQQEKQVLKKPETKTQACPDGTCGKRRSRNINPGKIQSVSRAKGINNKANNLIKRATEKGIANTLSPITYKNAASFNNKLLEISTLARKKKVKNKIQKMNKLVTEAYELATKITIK